MTPPEGNTLRHLQSIVADLHNGVDVWPADADERRVDDFLRRSRARPVERAPLPPLAWFFFGAAVMALCVALAAFAATAIANGAAAAVQAHEVAGW